MLLMNFQEREKVQNETIQNENIYTKDNYNVKHGE